VPVFALSRFDEARRKMSLMRDVFPIHFDTRGLSPGVAARSAAKQLHDLGLLDAGDRIIVTNGDSMERRGATNTLRLLEIGVGGHVEGLGEL
jgi:pyruvate kinase